MEAAKTQEFTATGNIRTSATTVAGLGLGSGITAVDLYDGDAATDPFVARVTATTSFPVPLVFSTGVHAVVTGTGKVSLWIR